MKSAENIEKLIKNLDLDIDINTKTDRVILGELIEAHEKSQKTKSALAEPNIRNIIMKSPITKLAAVIALICTGVVTATVVGIKIYNYRVVDKDPKRGYILVSDDGRFMKNIPESWAGSPEEALKTEKELTLLKQQNAGELVRVVEKEVNGKLTSRWLQFKYVLSDGREIKSSDYDFNLKESITEEQEEEVIRLVRADEYVTMGFEKKEIRGRMFTFERNRFVLSDGTEVIWSAGRPSEDSQREVKTIVKDAKEADQILNDKREINNLRQQDKRKLIGVDELAANGELDRRVLVYQYQLSDGRTKDLREGDELNFVLNKKQRQEWVQCKDSGSGEELGTYEEKVKDRMFVFKRQKFTLSDGTEVIWSYGTLKDDR